MNEKLCANVKTFCTTHCIPGPWCISGRTTLLLSSTIIAKINTWLALQLLSAGFMPLMTSLNNSKSQGTQMSDIPNISPLKSVKTWLVQACMEHKHLTNTHTEAHRHTCKQTQPGCWCALIHVHISPQPISQTHHYRPRSNLFVRGEMPRWIIHSSLIH